MNRLLREERGGIFVLSAFLIPIVFLVMFALIVDTGTWFTHKRQLQNRADAGALAAGVEYARVWACVRWPARHKAGAAAAIDTAARQFAGDPGQGTRYNTEVTDDGYSPNGSRINVEINSNAASGKVDPDTSWDDQPGGSGLGPCDKQPGPAGTGDRFSPKDAYYVDVGVRERDQRTFMGMFGVDLLRNEAHARVELEPAAAGKGFLPVALPEQNIQQAEIRYYQVCDPSNPVLLPGGIVTLQTLQGAPQSPNYQTIPGTTLWGPTVGNAPGGVPTNATLTMPDATACPGSPYIPVAAEVRIAGVDPTVININTADVRPARGGPLCRLLVASLDHSRVQGRSPDGAMVPGGRAERRAGIRPVPPTRTSQWSTRPVRIAASPGPSRSSSTAGSARGGDVDLSMGGVALDPPNGATGSPTATGRCPGRRSTRRPAGRT